MKQFNLRTGKLGEEIAKEYLEKKGYKILEQNYKTKYGEIDLIGKKGELMVFFEVRTKIGENFGTPEESLDKRKLKKLWLNATSYSARHKIAKDLRIDAICLVLYNNLKVQRLNHYENII